MSNFLVKKYSDLKPYVPGEQPKERKYIKLNTNESPFPPSPIAQRLARESAGDLQLYSDPECSALKKVASEVFGVKEENLIFTNGSDDVLNFAFMAFCDDSSPAVFPDITYGFYSVFAKLNKVPFAEIPLKEDFSIDVEDYVGVNKTVFIANPNSPTGIALPLKDVEKIVKSNPNNVVVVDEAYVDFGGESAIKLIDKYDNLLITQTFSKSRSLAGGRLGVGIANKNLISDLERIRYSTNPYNINRMTSSAGIGALLDKEYFTENCKKIIKNREYTVKELKRLGFTVLDSKSNFVFAKSDKIGGEKLYLKLKEEGILVRHFSSERLNDYVRISIGAMEDMKTFIKTVEKII